MNGHVSVRTLTYLMDNFTTYTLHVGALLPDGQPPRNLQLMRLAKPEEQTVSNKGKCDLWAYVWGASTVLCELVNSALQSQDQQGEALLALEVGAGSGPVSMVAALGGVHVVATDVVDDALDLCISNAKLNNIHSSSLSEGPAERPVANRPGNVYTSHLNWNNPVLPEQSPCWSDIGKYNIVLGSDVLYLSRAAKPLAHLIEAALVPGGVALICDPGRPSAETFEEALDSIECFVWEREDIMRVRASVCDLPKVTLFYVQKQPVRGTKAPVITLERWRSCVEAIKAQRMVSEGEDFQPSYRAK